MNYSDEQFMRLALTEAKKGEGRTSPNPCVGAVIVKNGKVIAQGYHKQAGLPHAEVNAIGNASESVIGATIYVTLEPCNHTGKTPPCTHAIVECGITRVVIGMTDPNPLVDGSGIEYLKKNGVEVRSGVLQDACEDINRPFIKMITQGIPWLIMKGGLSLDGKLNYQAGKSGWITGDESSARVHQLRDRVDAILVGGATIRIDNPSLTTRLPGQAGKDPIRIIVDSSLDLPLTAKVFNQVSEAATFVFCLKGAHVDTINTLRAKGVRIFEVEQDDDGVDLHQMLSVLGQEDICSVLVEGGSTIHGSFLKNKLFDVANLFIAPIFAGEDGISLVAGYRAEGRNIATKLKDVTYERLGEDIMVSGSFDHGG